MKSGYVIDYVHIKSNHPPLVTKAIGKGINHRLNANSSSKEMFDALVRSRHEHILEYSEVETGGEASRRRRRR